jgi:hypothetical protein
MKLYFIKNAGFDYSSTRKYISIHLIHRILCFIKYSFLIFILTMSSHISWAQTLGVNNTNPDSSSVLDLAATNRGILIPRMTQAQRNAIVKPAYTLLIYQTDGVPGFYYNVGTSAAPVWVPFLSTNASASAGTGGWSLLGNAGTSSATNFLGTSDNTDVIFKANNIRRLSIYSTTGDILIGDTNTGTIKANKELVLRQDGDTYGPSILRLRNRTTENGAIFETTDPTVTLIDYIFKTASNQRNIRYESRVTYARAGNPSFHIGGASPDAPTLALGDGYAAFNTPVRIGIYTAATIPIPQPTALLHLNAGTATANTAPLKFTSGTNLTTPEAGAIEFNGTNFFGTTSTPTRKTFAFSEDFANSYVTANVTNNTNALSNVTGMSFSIGANETWSFEFNLQNGCSGAGGVRYAISFPGTLRATVVGMSNAVTAVTSSVITVTNTAATAVNTVNLGTGWTRITGSVTNGATAGTIQLRFQSGTNGQTSTVYTNSYFTARKN